MNMKAKIIATSLLTLSALFSANTFANNDQAKAKAEFEGMMKEYQTAMGNAAKSGDIRGGLIKACGVQYKKLIELKKLNQNDVTKLCTCTIDTEGKITDSQKWAIQSAINAKNQSKARELQTNLMKSQQSGVKQCIGTTLDQKIAALAKSAQPPVK